LADSSYQISKKKKQTNTVLFRGHTDTDTHCGDVKSINLLAFFGSNAHIKTLAHY